MFAVFISGPYTQGSVKDNVNEAIKVANKIIDIGGLPLIPHLFHYIEKHNTRNYDIWLNLALALLDRADCLLRLPGFSPGADYEVAKAMELNIPVFNSLEELEAAFKVGSV
jgi:hypothetical protein